MITLEIINSVLTIISVYLLSKNNRNGWLLSIISCITMEFIYGENKLLYQMSIQIIFSIQSGIAFNKWDVKLEESLKKINLIYSLLFYFIISLSCLFFRKHNIIAFIDLFLMFISLVANHLLIYKKMSSWYLWLLFDIISIILFVYLELYITVMLFIILTIICIKTILDSHQIFYEKIQSLLSFR